MFSFFIFGLILIIFTAFPRNDLRKLTYNELQIGDTWKINMAQEILELKNGNITVNNLSSEEIDEILIYIVT